MPGPLTQAMGWGAQPSGPLTKTIASAQDPYAGLDWLDRALLAGGRGLDNLGLARTEERIYTDVVGRGRRDPLTEKDFTPQELSAFRGMVKQKGGASGKIDYSDYAGHPISSWTLGGFNYNTDQDGNVVISDQYDFNTDRSYENEQQRGLWSRLQTALLNPALNAAEIGRKVIPPGKGVDVRINLGRPPAPIRFDLGAR